MLHIVTGPPCGGKTYYVAQHKAPNDLVIDSDALAVALGSQVDHEHADPILSVALALRSTLIGQASHHPEWNAWLVQTFMTSAMLDEFTKAGAQLHVVDPGAAVCLARADDRGASREIRGVILEWYKNMRVRLPAYDQVIPSDSQVPTA